MFQFKHTKSYHKNHPNPQFYRSNFLNLNGKWKFAFDEENIGILQGFYKEFPQNHLEINVPYAYQTFKSGINTNDEIDYIWYEKEIEINDLAKVYLIHFLGVDYETDVFINGLYVFHHIGGYDAFSFELTNLIKGKNKITVRVTDKGHIDQIRGKQHWKNENETCFYSKSSGIYKDVYVEVLNKNYIKEFYLKGDYLTKTLKAKFIPNIEDDYQIEISFDDINKKFNFDLNNKKNEFLMTLDDVLPYSYENPKLYNLTIKLLKKGEICDEFLTYCGFISLKSKDGKIFINDKDTYLKMVLDQGYFNGGGLTPSEEDAILDLSLIRDCGFNGLRKHEKIETPLFYYYQDLFGLYASLEIPSVMNYSYDFYKQYNKQAPRMYLDNFNHPSIIEIVLFNETWGVFDIVRRYKEVLDFVNNQYFKFKKMAEDRFVISNDGWEQTYTDIITCHNYSETSHDLKKILDKGVEDIKHNKNALCVDGDKYFFVDGYANYKGQPFALTEFAGIAFNANFEDAKWGYGKGVTSETEYLAKYKDQLDYIYSNKNFRCFCMTQLTDVEQEINGIFTADRKAKININKLKKLHDRFK